MRKLFFLGMVCLMALSAQWAAAQDGFAGGKGTEGEPWQISNAEQLDLLRNYMRGEHSDKYFVLTQDIEMAGYLAENGAGYRDGKGWLPLGLEIGSAKQDYFSGTLDGQGNTIRGLWIDRAESDYSALFSGTNGATLKNVHIEVDKKGIKGLDYVAALVGSAGTGSVITRCSATGGAISGFYSIGGLVGYLFSGSITECFAMTPVQVLERGEEHTGGTMIARAGGLAGYLTEDASLTDSYATGNVSLANPKGTYDGQGFFMGSLLGDLARGCTITHSYALGKATAPKDKVGGLIGTRASDAGMVTSSYYNMEIHEKGVGSGSLSGIVGQNAEGLAKKDTYENWDFDGGIWTIDEEETAPYFPWQDENIRPIISPDDDTDDPDDDTEDPDDDTDDPDDDTDDPDDDTEDPDDDTDDPDDDTDDPDDDSSNPEEQYYTVRLVQGGDIRCNIEEGELILSENDHLYLQVYTEDPTLTAADILFTIDGVETLLQKENSNSFAYILNPIEKDAEIVVALKEYTITLPKIKGVISDPVAGKHRVEYEQPFSFTLTADGQTSLEEVAVFVNGEELARDGFRSSSLTFVVEKVTEHLTIEIEGVKNDPTGNLGIAGGQVNVTVDHGELHITNETGTAVDVAVYSITGKRVWQLRALRGTRSVVLPYGIYVVRAGEAVTKVSVK
ncbi:GLUG motif-containing protein [Parabacteroides sp. PF5-6]|uniref:GLUG motif-containing protein n=1 Tax=Parabacteroides sp. PF5-6 TaxID=1742403 RepID=UPI002406F3DB|nr:GLUG motif-containing protein [Parabacteroides sp. PF5-6]MDF9831533.1 hypothetical protein [Parabacteroides sp. PF5-6]